MNVIIEPDQPYDGADFPDCWGLMLKMPDRDVCLFVFVRLEDAETSLARAKEVAPRGFFYLKEWFLCDRAVTTAELETR